MTVATQRPTYAAVPGWGKLPDGWSFVEATAVGVDSKDNVYVYNRGAHPVIIFDRQGKFLRSWGEGMTSRAHGITIGPDDTVWLTDDGNHTIRQYTADGKLLLSIGDPDKPSPAHGGKPFNRPTHVALSPQTGDIYISDGYGNSRVHKYDPKGRLLLSWGEPGTDPGCFNIPHNIATDAEGLVYVADRENHRVQVFDAKGHYQYQINNLHRACALYVDRGERRADLRRRAALAPPGQRGRAEHRGPRERPHAQGRSPRPGRREVHGRGAGRVHRARTAS